MTTPNSTLMIHRPGSHRVSLTDLRYNIPTPMAMGPRHKPIPHWQVVEAITEQVAARGWTVAKQELAVARKGHMLFGVMDLRQGGPDPYSGDPLSPLPKGLGTCFGFRSSTNQSFALRGVAGTRVFVCDNMALSGTEFVMRHKLTLHLNLPMLISQALNKFIHQSQQLIEALDRMRLTLLTDQAAKTRIFDLVNQGAMPLHLFDDVSRFYFKPTEEEPDCQPRTAWGLHNACTRAMKVLSPAAHYTNTLNVGRVFQMANTEPVSMV